MVFIEGLYTAFNGLRCTEEKFFWLSTPCVCVCARARACLCVSLLNWKREPLIVWLCVWVC